jgi:hypothetical protein
VGEQGIGDPHVRRNGAAEIAGQQDRAEKCGARHRVERGRDQQRHAERADRRGIGRPPHFRRAVDDRLDHQELHAGVQQEEGDQQAADDPAGDDGFAAGWR